MASSSSLAVLGGKAIIDRSEWPSWPPRGANIVAALTEVAENDQWGIGSKAVARFQTDFAHHHDAEYGLAMANGTVALYAALIAVGVGPGDEVILPGYTFMASAVSVMQTGATPVLADVDPRTFNLDPAAAEQLITDKTKAIMPVHIGGNPADMDAFLKLADGRDIRIVEDAAQAPGAGYGGKKVGAIGDAGCFSFQSSKNMTAGEGGILLTNDRTVYEKAFEVYNCGRTTTGSWYEHVSPGTNLRLSAFQAAILQVQLETLDEDGATREANARYIEDAISEIDGLDYARRYDKTDRNAYHLLILTYDAEKFDGLPKAKFLEALMAEGVVATDGYNPLQTMPFFEGRHGDLAVTDAICRNQVWLRQFELMADRTLLERTVEAIHKVKDQAGSLL